MDDAVSTMYAGKLLLPRTLKASPSKYKWTLATKVLALYCCRRVRKRVACVVR